MKDFAIGSLLIFALIAIPILGIGSCMRYYPEYQVWQQGMEGRAVLAKAEFTKQARTADATAKKEAATLEAEAEAARASGIEAISKALGGPNAERYLRLRYIMMMEEKTDGVQREVIYLPPNDASLSLPITEAARLRPVAPQ
jgi:regulator of protease activity HflC (stomatin/prohibitin superfamily)